MSQLDLAEIQTINELLIPRFGKMFIPDSGFIATGTKPRKHYIAFNLSLAAYGYVADTYLCWAMESYSETIIKQITNQTTDTLNKLLGGHVDHSVLFKNFPNETMDDSEYMLKRFIGHFSNVLNITVTGTPTLLSCGHIIDSDLFDLNKYGACPVCQHQVPELDGTDDWDAVDAERMTPLTMLGHATQEDLETIANDLINQQSSLNPQEQKLLRILIRYTNVQNLNIHKGIFKETLPIVAALLMDYPEVVLQAISGATDVLRIATYMSNNDADLSLSSPTKFKLVNRERHFILSLLNSILDTDEDMMRHREKWIKLGEVIHPSKFEKRYPITYQAFIRIRNYEKSLETFNRLVERELTGLSEDGVSYDVSKKLLDALKSRPSEFGRRLDYVIRCHQTHEGQFAVITAFSMAVDKIPTMLVLSMIRYFENRNDTHTRYFLPKGMMNKIQVVPDTRPKLEQRIVDGVIDILESSMIRRYENLPALPYFVFDEIVDYVIPFNSRGDSESSKAVSKWSQIPNDHRGVIRFFTYWKAPVDVDLSVTGFDKDMNQLFDCSYYHLSEGDYAVHSGDIQNGSRGATEHVDVDITKALKAGVRYITMFVNMYSMHDMEGIGFEGFECFSGFMNRDTGRLSKSKNFDVNTVEWKFNLDKPAEAMVPVIFDLQKGKMVYADLVMSIGQFQNINAAGNKVKNIMEVVMNAANTKPTIGQLLKYHMKARPVDAYTLEQLSADDIPNILKEYMI